MVIAPPIVLGAASLVLEKMSLSVDGTSGHLHAAGLVSLLTALMPLGLLILGLVALVYVKTRSFGFILVFSCVAFTVVASSIIDLRQTLREVAFEKLILRTTSLVEAIHAYERVRGEAPEKLNHIVPQYLKEIPGTQLGAYPKFEYQRLPDPDLMAGNTWMLALPISASPRSRLVYLPARNYEFLEGTKQSILNWVYVYQQPPGR